MLPGPMQLSAEALTDVRVCVLPRTNFLRFFQDHPEIAVRLTWLAARCEARAQDHLVNIGRRPADARIAHLLLELYYRVQMGLPRIAGETMPFPLTQEHLGDALGLTSVHVNRMLRQLREQGIVAVRERQMEILNPEFLIETAEFDEGAFFAG